MAATWWLGLQVLGLAALPLTLRVFRGLPDRGWLLARPFGLLLTSFVFWHAVTWALPNSRGSVVAAVVLVAAISWWLGRSYLGDLRHHLWRLRWHLLVGELLFLLAFVFYLFVRSHLPSLDVNEKPMELAMLNGVLRSQRFPPLDPWFAGHSISYYYFGYVITALMTRLTDLRAEVGFNLMLGTLFSLTATGAYAIASNLGCLARGAAAAVGPSIRVGLVGLTFVLLMGNLETPLEVLNAHSLLPAPVRAQFVIRGMPPPAADATFFPDASRDPEWWWRASRVVWTGPAPGQPPDSRPQDYTINEFPYFSFLIGDLHPHLFGLGFSFLALAIVLALFASPLAAGWREGALFAGSAAIVLGAFGPLNTWDLPTYLGLFLAAVVLAMLRMRDGRSPHTWLSGLALATAVAGLSILLYLPFYQATDLRQQATGFVPVRFPTHVSHFVLFWGPFYLAITAYLLEELRRRIGFVRGVALVLLPGLAVGLRFGPVAGALVLPIVAALILVLAKREPAGAFAHLLALTGASLILVCELIYVRDMFGGRTNTVFKLYYQAWVLLALAVAFVVWRSAPLLLVKDRRPVRRVLAASWGLGLAGLFGLALLYPIGATASRTNGLSGPRTLDGLADWRAAYPDEMAAIDWLREHVDGAPVVVEATGDSYRAEIARVSRSTGLPTVVGWLLHERQFRGSSPEVYARRDDVAELYGCRLTDRGCDPLPLDRSRIEAILRKYDVKYIFVGGTERAAYQVPDERFAWLDVAYRNPGVTIFRVLR